MATGVGDLDLERSIRLKLCCHRRSYRQTGGVTNVVRRNQVVTQASKIRIQKQQIRATLHQQQIHKL